MLVSVHHGEHSSSSNPGSLPHGAEFLIAGAGAGIAEQQQECSSTALYQCMHRAIYCTHPSLCSFHQQDTAVRPH